MNKAQQMLAKAGFPDTAAGRAAFHKQYPTPESFFQVHGGQYKNGGPVMYGDGTKVYSTSDQNTNQVGNKYQNTFQEASTNIDPNSNTSQQFIRQTNNPNQTPYLRYFNDNELGSEMNIAGPNGNMFIKPDPMMDNFLKTRTNYMSGAMAGEQMKRNGGMIKYDVGGMIDENQFTSSELSGPPEPPPKDKDYAMYGGYDNYINMLSGKSNLERFPKKDPGFGFRGPGSYLYYMDRLKHRNVKTVNPNAGVKDAPVNMHTITGSCESGTCFEFEDGGTVDAYQLMGMPTPPMYGGGSGVHPTLTLSTENNLNPSFKPQYSNNPYYNKTYSVNNRNTVAGTLPLINNKLNLTGSYSDANDGTYTAGAELNLGDILSGAGGKGPSRRYDNPDIAHKGNNSFLDTYGHLKAGVTNKGDKVLPYFGGDFTVAHQMGRVKGPNGLRQPKGTAYASAELNQVEDPLNAMYENDNYMRANLGGSYNFGKGLGIYGEAGYDFMRNAPRGEIGLKKTFADGGHINHYIPSYNFGHVQSANNTYRHGFGYGGPIGMYNFGSVIKDIGAGAYGALEGTLDTVTMGATDQLTDKGYKALQKAGGSSESEITQQDSIHGYGQAAGAITGAIVNPSSLGTAITEGSQGIGQGISQGSPDSKSAQQWGKGIEMVGGIAGMATGMGAFGAPGGGAAGLAKTNSFNASDVGKFAGKAGKVGQGFNAMSSGDPMQMMSTFGGMGGGSNMGGTGTSNFSPDPNKYTNQGIDFTSTAPSFNAMGGAVNAPNMMQYGQGGRTMLPPNVSTGRAIVNRYDDGGNTPATEINVEKGELLVNKDGKILTEYKSNNMVPHPEGGGMDPRGTVPAKEGDFVITKRLAPNYKAAMTNNDKLYADSMRNNIAFDKQRKDAKQQAEQQSQQAMAEQTMMAKFGGMVGQYGYGGGVMKYDGGGGTPYADQSMMSAEADRYAGPDLNLQTNPFGFQRNKNPYMQNWNPIQPNNPTYNPTWTNRGGSPPPIEMDMQGSPSYQYENNLGTSAYGSSPTNVSGYTPTGINNMDGTTDVSGYTSTAANGTPSWFDRNKGDLATAGGKAMLYGPGLYNLGRGIFEKPFNMNAADYQTQGRMKPYEEQYRPDYRTYNAAMYSSNQTPGSGSLAGRTNLYNAAEQQYADQRYKVNQANLGRRMAADQVNLGIEGTNKNMALQIAQFNEQNKAAKRNMLGQGLTDLSSGYQFEKGNQMTGNALGSIMQHYTVLPDGTMVPKAGYNPAAYNSIYNAGNTPTTNSYDPNLASPNRYSGGINFTPTKPSFRTR